MADLERYFVPSDVANAATGSSMRPSWRALPDRGRHGRVKG